MSRSAPGAALLLVLACPAGARERVSVFDAPKTSPVVPIAAPSLDLRLPPASSPGLVSAPWSVPRPVDPAVLAQGLRPIAAPQFYDAPVAARAARALAPPQAVGPAALGASWTPDYRTFEDASAEDVWAKG